MLKERKAHGYFEADDTDAVQELLHFFSESLNAESPAAPLEDETETVRPHRPLALLPQRTGALRTAARQWRKPAVGTIFPKSKLVVALLLLLPFSCGLSA